MRSLNIAEFLASNPVLTLALIAHILADFHWQSQDLADRKVISQKALWEHLGIVAIPLVISSILSPTSYLVMGLVWLSHVLIDHAKFFLAPKFTNGRCPAYLFTVDQFCHYLAIIGIYLAISPQQTQLILNPNWLILALFFLIITKPINIIFKLFFERYQVELEDTSSISGAGAMVGNLERLIIGIFLILGQYAAIALVFTAKSIARYDMISKNQGFAEYYLIGSLFSMISVLVTYALLIF